MSQSWFLYSENRLQTATDAILKIYNETYYIINYDIKPRLIYKKNIL